ncbi:GntR family transcriptional regulator [Jeotgalibaca porci]|uniref:GntR family transcriptional regulator n=1 Tax=Jeotgalibaca porci TaxID=1868793 RepID=UPI0035A03373
MEFNRRSPVYEQLVNHFKEQIANNELKPGQELPSRREIAATYKINPNTAQRAFKEMEESGLIYTDGNSPSKITEDTELIKEARIELLDSALDNFITVAMRLGLTYEDLNHVIAERFKEEKANA